METTEGRERLSALEAEVRFIKELLVTINTKLDNNVVPRSEISQMFSNRDDRIQKLEDRNKLITGALIAGAISWLFLILDKITKL